MRISDWSSDVCSSDLSCLLPTLSHLSVNTSPVCRLRHWCSSEYLRISPLHSEFHSPLLDSSDAVLKAIPGLSPGLSPLTCKAAYVRLRPVIPNNASSLRITAAAGTELAGAYSPGTVLIFPGKRALQPSGLHHSRGIAGSGFRPLSTIPHCCLP